MKRIIQHTIQKCETFITINFHQAFPRDERIRLRTYKVCNNKEQIINKVS